MLSRDALKRILVEQLAEFYLAQVADILYSFFSSGKKNEDGTITLTRDALEEYEEIMRLAWGFEDERLTGIRDSNIPDDIRTLCLGLASSSVGVLSSLIELLAWGDLSLRKGERFFDNLN